MNFLASASPRTLVSALVTSMTYRARVLNEEGVKLLNLHIEIPPIQHIQALVAGQSAQLHGVVDLLGQVLGRNLAQRVECQAVDRRFGFCASYGERAGHGVDGVRKNQS